MSDCDTCRRTWVHLPHDAGCPKAEGALVPCPLCKGEGWYETGDSFNGYYLEAGATVCRLCQRNGDAAGFNPKWWDEVENGTGRIALPIAPAVLAFNAEEGEDHCSDLYRYVPDCHDCEDTGLIHARHWYQGRSTHIKNQKFFFCACASGEAAEAAALQGMIEETGFDPRHRFAR